MQWAEQRDLLLTKAAEDERAMATLAAMRPCRIHQWDFMLSRPWKSC